MLDPRTAVVVRGDLWERGRAATAYRKGSTARRASPYIVYPVRKEPVMIRRFFLLALVSVLLPVGLASAQESYPIMERVAQKIIQHYQIASY